MIDVLMILLVFFMVTSTYMDLRMMPVVDQSETPVETRVGDGASGKVLLLVLGRNGQVRQGGQTLSQAELGQIVRERLATAPDTAVMVLPSGQAEAQALVSTLDTLTNAGATSVQVLRLETAP